MTRAPASPSHDADGEEPEHGAGGSKRRAAVQLCARADSVLARACLAAHAERPSGRSAEGPGANRRGPRREEPGKILLAPALHSLDGDSMPALGHLAVGLAIGRLAAPRDRPAAGALALHACLALAPDLDAIGMVLWGRPFPAPFAHRGATHSLAVALLAALLVAALSERRPRAFASALAAAASHGLLDMCTHGARGVAFLWPFLEGRVRFPWAPLAATPMGGRLLSGRGLSALAAEALLYAPLLVYALWPRRGPGALRAGAPAAGG